MPLEIARVADSYATVDELAAALHTTVSAKNADWLAYSVAAASDEIDHQCGRPADGSDPIRTGDAIAHAVCIARGVEHYKANDAAFGALGFDGTGVIQAPRDGFARHAADLIPLTRTFGIA